MKSAIEQLATYKSVHLNPKNIRTHFIGVPAIIWSLLLFMSFIRFDIAGKFELSLAMAFAAVVALYYFILHVRLAIGLMLFILPVLFSVELISTLPNAGWIGVSVFVIAWGIQFLGHKYEKAKPAFIDDLNQLLIGPFFLMAEVYFMLGLEKELNETITPIARDKRRALEAAKRAA